MRKLFIALTLSMGSLFLLSFLVFALSLNPKELVKNLTDGEVLFALKFSLLTALISTFIVMILAVPSAYALSRYRFPLKRVVGAIIDLPMAFPEILTGLVLLMLFSDLLTPLLRKVNLEVVFTPAAVVIAQVAVSLPFAIKVLHTAFNQIDRRYEWIARSLGYAPAETFLKVTLPMAKGGLVSATAVAFARSVGAFGAVLVFAGGIRMKTETLPVGIFLALSVGETQKAITMGVLLMAIAFTTLLLLELFNPEGGEKFRD